MQRPATLASSPECASTTPDCRTTARRDDLEEWAARLDELGIPHSGVKQPTYTQNAMLTFRDPDNIQLEFFWRAPSDSTA
jgi:hypothetical protein